jgi:hypothetical protein
MTETIEQTLSARAMTNASLAEQTYATYLEMLPETIEYDQIFYPTFWRHHKKLRPYTMIRLRRVDGAFDVFVTVRTSVAGGLVVEFHSGRPPRGVDPYALESEVHAEAAKLKVAPIGRDGKPVIKVEFLPKIKWRVLGLGSEEIQRNIETRDQAEIAMADYLRAISMRNPTDEELLAESKRRAAAQKPAAGTQPTA